MFFTVEHLFVERYIGNHSAYLPFVSISVYLVSLFVNENATWNTTLRFQIVFEYEQLLIHVWQLVASEDQLRANNLIVVIKGRYKLYHLLIKIVLTWYVPAKKYLAATYLVYEAVAILVLSMVVFDAILDDLHPIVRLDVVSELIFLLVPFVFLPFALVPAALVET